MYRSYLHIPYRDKDEAKNLCRELKLLRLCFDEGRKLWFYPDRVVPAELTRRWPVTELIEATPDGHTVPIALPAPPIWPFEPTPEQVAMCQTEPGGAENVLIIHAFAGGSKTTSLRAYARARPNARMYYLAFGHANAKDARETFPPNTQCSTIHALAHAWLPNSLRSKVTNSFKSDTVCKLLGHDTRHIEKLALGTLIVMLLEGFWTSSDPYPAAHHLGPAADHLNAASWSLAPSIDHITHCALRVWQMMTDPDHPAPLTHEGYLKLYALSNPTWNIDYCLLDEAQDTNPVTEALVFSQPCKKVLVGDPHQNVYKWRRARDILTPRLDAGAICVRLTHSFRFGPQIAELANVILSTLKGEQAKVVGRGRNATLFLPGDGRWHLHRDGSFQSFTWISRSNMSLFDAAVETVGIIDAYEQVTGKPGPKIGFVGTSRRFGFNPFHAYKFGRLLDLVRLGENQHDKIHDPFIAQYPNIKALWDHVTSSRTADPELEAAIRIYRRYKRALPALITKITNRSQDPHAASTWVRFSTAHKAKGLEWDCVRLAGDFVSLVGREQGTTPPSWPILPNTAEKDEEINLLYVAITRAKIQLELNSQLCKYLVATNNSHLMTNFMPGTCIEDLDPVSWDAAVTYFGGDPIALRAQVMEARAREAEARARQREQTSAA